jgi:hypothetical protein
VSAPGEILSDRLKNIIDSMSPPDMVKSFFAPDFTLVGEDFDYFSRRVAAIVTPENMKQNAGT